jgi:hypothetical protein
VDFWAQHKEFVLKVLAGLGVFLVALIARSITYGDDLEKAKQKNVQLVGQIGGMRIAPMGEIQALEGDATKLRNNAEQITHQIGWNLADRTLEQTLLVRILSYTRTYAQAGEAEVQRAAEDYRAALREDLNGGFGRLRLMVRQELVEEASEKNIKVAEGIGYENVTEMDATELTQYLIQLELVARVARYAIDAGVDKIEEVRITARQAGRRRDEVIPGANPEFLEEYRVILVIAAGQPALLAILDRLETEEPRVPLVGIKSQRLKRPADHLNTELTLLAVAANPEKPFAAPEEAP